MRILMVHPGPDFSVADVFNGWRKAFEKQGHKVITYNTNDRITFYDGAYVKDANGEYQKAFASAAQVADLALAGLFESAYVTWPDMIFFVSGFWTSPKRLEVLKSRGHKIVMLHTESPYQDEEQFKRGRIADLNLLNDPTNLEVWRSQDVNTHYMPHSYDPDVHFPRLAGDPYEFDFSFVGSPFLSRQKFLASMDFTGIDAVLGGGYWGSVSDEYKHLLNYLGHDTEESVDNTETAAIYRRTKVGINIYRKEGEEKGEAYGGYSMGPREVEMAACGLFFLRDPRPESDDTFGETAGDILPSFESPEEATELLRFWVKHDDVREHFAALARERIADWTFDNMAKELMRLIAA
jgi:hypothetical protein